MIFIYLLFLEESIEDNEENEELPVKKRRRLALEDLSDDENDLGGDEEDSGDEYVPGICCKFVIIDPSSYI